MVKACRTMFLFFSPIHPPSQRDQKKRSPPNYRKFVELGVGNFAREEAWKF